MQCKYCGCTDDNCSGCIERTGEPCYWVAPNVCSACAEKERQTEEAKEERTS